MKRITIFFLLIFFIATSVYAEDNKFTFDFPKDTTLKVALQSIAARDGREIIINISSDKLVTMTLYNKSVNEALDLLSKDYEFNWVIDNNTIMVTPADVNTQMKRFILKNADLKLVKEELLSFVPESKIRINPEYNSISVDGTPGLLQKVQNTISQLDVPVEQIFIMTQMVEVNRTDALKLGFQYSLPNYDNSTRPFRAQFTVTSSGLKSFDNGTILARPAITTFNGQEASVLMGDQVPVIQQSTATNGTTDSSVTFQPVGATLKVTPFINDKEKKIITLNLDTNYSSVAKWITSGSVQAPQISTRQAKTKVRVKSGDNIVIGGLMRQSDIESLNGIPGLMKLPILGKLFSYKEKSKDQSEVFFIVTPYLLDDDTTIESLQNMVRNGNNEKKPVKAAEKPKEDTGIKVDDVKTIEKDILPDVPQAEEQVPVKIEPATAAE
jgi:type IV pilus assembly protein PilQ